MHPLIIPRLNNDQFFMLQAHIYATRSTCNRGNCSLLFDPERHGAGVVLVRGGFILAGSGNESPPGQPRCSEFVCPECEWEASPGDAELIAASPCPTIESPKDDGPLLCPNCQTPLEGGHIFQNNRCVQTIPAAESVILQCALKDCIPEDATLYTTTIPCTECAMRLIYAQVFRVVCDVAGLLRVKGMHPGGNGANILVREGIPVDYLDIRSSIG